MTTARDDETHTCATCGEHFPSETALEAHRSEANHAEKERSDKLECSRCGFLMESEEELRRHMAQNHSAQGAR